MSDGQPKSFFKGVRFDAPLLKRIQLAGERTNVDFSKKVREFCRDGLRKEEGLIDPNTLREQLFETTTEIRTLQNGLHRVGVNVNQIAKKLNAKDIVNEEGLSAAINEVQGLMKASAQVAKEAIDALQSA